MWLLCLLLLTLTHATKTLVIVRDLVDKTTYSQFLRDLKNRGHELSFKTANENIHIESYGIFPYDNLILLSPNSKKFGDVGTKALLNFLDSGRNMLILVNDSPSKMYKNLASNLGLEIRTQAVMDHFHHNTMVPDSKNHTFITTTAVFPSLKTTELPIAYHGVAFTMKPKTQFAVHLLTPEQSGYNKFGAGSELGLVTSVQIRNNARATFVGSSDFLSNAYAMTSVEVGGVKSSTGNGPFIQQALAFAFKEIGVIRSSNARHFLLDGSGPMNPNRYTIKDKIRYEVLLEEYHLDCKCWKPYTTRDVEFTLVRLDPFIRQVMNTNGDGIHYLEFTLPDMFGIFKFIVDYKRMGFTYVYEELEASVRPLRHDQHERFLVSAYPYYAACLSMILGFFVFGFLFVNSEPDTKKPKAD